MCLYATEEPFIVEEDMTVYKVIALNNESMIQKFPYVPFHTYKTKLGVTEYKDADMWRYRIDTGFHAYIRAIDASDDIREIDAVNAIFHSHVKYKIDAFTVPKGAEVYRSFPYLVSDTIRSGSLEPAEFV